MADELPMRQFDLTDAAPLRAWLADTRARYPEVERFDEAVRDVMAPVGREYPKVSAASKAQGRGQRGGGSARRALAERLPPALVPRRLMKLDRAALTALAREP